MAEEKSNALSSHVETKHVWQLLAIIAVTTIVWNLPTSAFGIDGLTIVQQRIIAIFVFATLSWLTECIPAWATSLSIMSIMCVTVSKNAFGVFKGEGVGDLLDSKEIMASFADPIIMLLQVLSWRLPLQSRDLTHSWHVTLSSLSETKVRMFFWDSCLLQDSSQCSSQILQQRH